MHTEKPIKKGGPRTLARLAAVQALYQLEMQEEPNAGQTVAEYIEHRLGKEIEGDTYAEADAVLFKDIVSNSFVRQTELDEKIIPHLNETWPFLRIERILRAILRAGMYEIAARPDVPTPVIINEYVDIAHAFFDRKEANFVNGILDKLAKEHRT